MNFQLLHHNINLLENFSILYILIINENNQLNLQGNGMSQIKKRWEIIENSLSKPIKNIQELTDTIISYNTKFRNIWRFRALNKLFDEVCITSFFNVLRLLRTALILKLTFK